MKLCLIGNSHLAAFRMGWNGLAAEAAGVEATFFGARGGELAHLRNRNGVLTSPEGMVRDQLRFTSGGEEAIHLDRYDAFVLVGIGLGLAAMLRVAAQHRTVGTVGKARFQHLVSDAVFDIGARAIVEESISQRIAGWIREVSDKPIIGATLPMPCPGALTARTDFWTDAELLAARLEPVWLASKAFMERRRAMTILDQPEETRHGRWWTKASYGRGSVRLKEGFDERHDENEYFHMNGAYGEAFLRTVLPRFGVQLSPAPVRARAG